MMKHLLLIPLALLTAGRAASQDTPKPVTDKQLVNGARQTTFGASQQAVGDYLLQQNLLPETDIPFKRVAYRLLIDHKGKVTEATPFFGGISAELDETIARSLIAMPSWKTTIREDQLSVVYLVVVVQGRSITTELH